jgi:hypothetical protein
MSGNEFVARKGLISFKSSSFNETLFVSGSISSPSVALLTASWANETITSSFALTSSLDLATPPLYVTTRSIRLVNEDGDTINAISTSSLSSSFVTIPSSKVVWDAVMVSTGNGVISGMELIKGTITGSFNINSGSYYIIDKGIVEYLGTSSVLINDLTSSLITYINIDVNGNITQCSTTCPLSERRDEVFLGVVVHSDHVNINTTNNLPDVAVKGLSQYNDLLDSLGCFNIEGNVFSANDSSLRINKSLGTIFKRGSNFSIDNKNPHVKTMAALNAPSTLRFRTQTGIETLDAENVDCGYYDFNGVRTAITSGFQNMRIAMFTSNLVRIQYGQTVYLTMADALNRVNTELFVVEQNISDNGLFRCILTVSATANNLADPTQAVFTQTGRFGEILGGTGTTTDLQQAYNISSPSESIVTSNTIGAFSIKRGSNLDSDNVLVILNGSGSIVAQIDGNGSISSSQAIISSITGSVYGTSSYALMSKTASYSSLAQTSSYVETSQTASYVILSQTASYIEIAQTASYVETSQTASYVILSQTASYVTIAQTASYISLSAHNNAIAGQGIVSSSAQFTSADNFTVGTITASSINVQSLNVTTITSSVVVITGSNIFGSSTSNTHQFTGSVFITGSLTVTGPINGTSSWAINSQTASYISLATHNNAIAGQGIASSSAQVVSLISDQQISPTGVTSSLFGTSSWAINSQTSSYVLLAQSASISQTASYISLATHNNAIVGQGIVSSSVQAVSLINNQQISPSEITSSLFGTSSWALNANNAKTASYSILEKTQVQSTVTPNTFENVSFNTNVFTNGFDWTYSNGTNTLSCNVPGVYVILVSAYMQKIQGTAAVGGIRLVKNGTEIQGTYSSFTFSANNTLQAILINTVTYINSGDVIQLQMVGATTAIQITTVPSIGNPVSTPAANLMITRI